MDCADRISEMALDLERERLRWPEGEPLIVSPSHGRAGRCKVLELIPDIPLCVPASQETAYRSAHPQAELIVHSDEIVGIAPKRQWLLDTYGDVFMLDDDTARLVDLSVVGPGATVTDPEIVRAMIVRLFDQAAQMGAYLLGFANFSNPISYRPQLPFSLTGSVAGRAIGLRAGSKLFFPRDQMLMTDDLYVSALNAYMHRFLLLDNRYAFMAPGTWKNVGGMAAHRTWERLLENNEFLRSLFGEAIVDKQGSHIAAKKNDAQLSLKVPW